MGKWKNLFAASLVFALALASPSVFAHANQPQNQDAAQQASVLQSATVMGTVTDVNGSPVPGATVVLQGSGAEQIRSVTTNENGFFEIREVEAGPAYQVVVHADGFSEWESLAFTLEPGHSKILDDAKLQIKEVNTTVTVTPETAEEIATAQVKSEEKQRGFVIIPNFFAAYSSNPAPLTTGLKFHLSFKAATDPFTFAGVALLAGVDQGVDNPDYVQGAKGYGERFGARYANSATDIFLEGAVLPSLLHQDPRYFYKGTGSSKSRVVHVVESLFVAKGDSGNSQPNYSLLGGAAASAGLENLYYPRANRGAGLVLQSFGTSMAVHTAVRMLDEFVFRPAKGSVSGARS